MNNAIERSNRCHCLRIWENLGQESDTATTGPKCERKRRLELRQIRAVLERESKNSKKGKGSWGNERVTARTTTTIIFLDLHYTPAQTVAFLKLL